VPAGHRPTTQEEASNSREKDRQREKKEADDPAERQTHLLVEDSWPVGLGKKRQE